MKSTCAFTAARLYCVPPCNRKRLPIAERFGICETYSQMFLGSTLHEPGHDLFGLPSLALEVYDVGLHEHRAAVAELGKPLRAEGRVGILLHRHVESLRGGLQEVAVAGRALRVQLEVFDAAVLQDDDLDVLPADVADHIDVVVEVQAGLGVRDGFDQRRVRADHVLQNILGVARGAHAQDLQRRALVARSAVPACPSTSMVSSIGLPFESW